MKQKLKVMETALVIGAIVIAVGVILDIFPKLKAFVFGWKIGTIEDARRAYGEGNYEHKYLGSFLKGGFISVFRKKRG